MITPSFGLTATERVLPKLALDFTTAALDSRVTFTRTTGAANPATYVNSSGVITAATNNQPRFDYDPVTLACKGLLIEESRTNILTYSSDFSTSWVLNGATINSTATTAPDGTLTATKLIEDGGITTHEVNRTNVFVADGSTRSFSLYVKEGERRYIAFSNGALFSNINNTLIFDMRNGEWTYGAPANGLFLNTQNAGNGWWKISFNSASPSAAYDNVRIGLCNDSSSFTAATYQGDGTSGAYIWGTQIEAGAFATSYIPTTTTALTRNADVATMTGTNFSSWFNASEGTFVVQSTIANTTNTAPVQIDDGTNNNRFFTVGRLNTVSATAAGVVNGGSSQANIGNFTFATTSKIALAYKQNNFAASVNGANAITDTSGTIPTVDRLNFMYNNTTFGTGLIQNFRYWPQRLTNAEVQAITK